MQVREPKDSDTIHDRVQRLRSCEHDQETYGSADRDAVDFLTSCANVELCSIDLADYLKYPTLPVNNQRKISKSFGLFCHSCLGKASLG
jgi:hypothetical protein